MTTDIVEGTHLPPVSRHGLPEMILTLRLDGTRAPKRPVSGGRTGTRTGVPVQTTALGDAMAVRPANAHRPDDRRPTGQVRVGSHQASNRPDGAWVRPDQPCRLRACLRRMCGEHRPECRRDPGDLRWHRETLSAGLVRPRRTKPNCCHWSWRTCIRSVSRNY